MADDEALASARGRAVVEDLYGRYGALVYRTCRRILGDHHAAEDATQEVFAKLVVHPVAAEVRDPRRWLLEVTRNHCIDRLWVAARRPTAPIAASCRAPEDAEARSLAREHLRWLLSLLTPRQRDVVVRQAVLDEPLDTVASSLGLSYGAAAQALYRARAVLARAGATGDAAAIAVGAPIADLGRRLHALVQRLAAGTRLQAGRAPLDAALALPVAALVVSLLSGGGGLPHPAALPVAAPPASLAVLPAAVRGPARSAPSTEVVVTVHHPAAPLPSPPASPPAPVPTPPSPVAVRVLSRPTCVPPVAGITECLTPAKQARLEVGGLPPLP